jgi:hypothetical protein
MVIKRNPVLTVWSVCVGDKYSDEDVHILKNMASRHLSAKHRFMCLSDRPREGIDCLIPSEVWPGWWSKLLLFKYGQGQCLYLDLDVVVTGPLDSLLSRCLSMPSNWAQSGHGGAQSSVMAWDGHYPELYDRFNPGNLSEPVNGNCGSLNGLWGDQEYITQIMGDPGGRIYPMKGVYSYKYHCRKILPDDAIVVCFHGSPKPAEVNEPWILAERSSTITQH